MRAIQQWDFQPACDEEENFIDVCHILMSHKAAPPADSSIISKSENSEQLLRRLQIVKEWVTQRNVGMVVLSHVPVEIYRRGVAEIAAYFAANTLVPVRVEPIEIRTETPCRQSKTGIAAWTPREEILQRKVEILPALDRSLSSSAHPPSCDDITPFPGRQDPDPILERRPSKLSNAAWVLHEDVARVDHNDASPVNDVVAVIPAEKVTDAVNSVDSIPTMSGPETATCVKNATIASVDPESKPTAVACEAFLGPVISAAKPALPPVSTRSGRPPVAALQLYRLTIMCATGLRRVLKYRRQNPYCICQLVRGDGEVLVQVQTSVHPGGGQVPTWRGQVFELALTPENTRTCTLVFILKHSGVVTSLEYVQRPSLVGQLVLVVLNVSSLL